MCSFMHFIHTGIINAKAVTRVYDEIFSCIHLYIYFNCLLVLNIVYIISGVYGCGRDS